MEGIATGNKYITIMIYNLRISGCFNIASFALNEHMMHSFDFETISVTRRIG